MNFCLLPELQPRVRGWLLGSVDGKKKGLGPANYVKILGKRKGKRHLAKQLEQPATPSVHAPALTPSASQPAGLTDNPGHINSAAWTPTHPTQDLEANFQQAGGVLKEANTKLVDSFGDFSSIQPTVNFEQNSARLDDTEAASILQNSENTSSDKA